MQIQWIILKLAMFNPANWGFDTESAKTDLSSLIITVCSDNLSPLSQKYVSLYKAIYLFRQ